MSIEFMFASPKACLRTTPERGVPSPYRLQVMK